MRLLVFCVVWFASMVAVAQEKPYTDLVQDIRMLNGRSVAGSARALALGGVESPLGASVQSIVSNPAGIGLHRRFDFNVSTMLSSEANTLSSKQATPFNDLGRRQVGTAISSIGVVFNNDEQEGKLTSSSFALSYNKLHDYNYSFEYAGKVIGGMRTTFLPNLQGTPQYALGTPDLYDPDFNVVMTNRPEVLAYFSYVVDPVDENDPYCDEYITAYSDSVSVLHEEYKSTGSKSVWDASYGVNIGHRLYLGVGVGLGVIVRKIERTYTEHLEENYNNGLIGYSFEQNIENRGYGVNLKLGAIYKVNDAFRLSWAFHTGTRYRMMETYRATMTTVLALPIGVAGISTQTSTLNNEYVYREPWRMNGGLAYFFANKKGFFAMELEYQQFKKTKLSGGGLNWGSENEQIKNRYHSMLTQRYGVEYRQGLLRYRLGMAWFGNPDKNAAFFRSLMGGGIGLKWHGAYLDFAVAYEQSQMNYNPYSGMEVLYNTSAMHYTVTMGITFAKD